MKIRNKSKKGFTLVELIAVIAILAVTLTIAATAITTVKKGINEKQQKNLQTQIKAAAQGYHDDTGVNIVPVGVLLQIGTLQADTTEYSDDTYEIGDPVILDPVEGTPINCDAIVFNTDGSVEYKKGEGCSTEAISENELTLQYEKVEDGKRTTFENNGSWIALKNTSSTVEVTANAPYASNPNSITYVWINALSPDTSYEGKTLTISMPDQGYINEEYTVSAVVDGVSLSKSFNIQIDPKAPTIENYYGNPLGEWTQTKDIYTNLIDAESGLASYAISLKDCTDESLNYTAISGKNQTVKVTITDNGDYNICAKDIAGHLSKTTDAVHIEQVDNAKPVIEVATPTSEQGFYAKSKHFTITLRDIGDSSGLPENIAGFNNETVYLKYAWSASEITDCNSTAVTWTTVPFTLNTTDKSITSSSIEVNGFTGNGKIYVCPNTDNTIKDKAGNVVEYKPVSQSMMLDNTPPTCANITPNQSTISWINTSRTVEVTCSDDHSKCVKTTYSESYNTSTNSDSITISDNAGNTTVCSFKVYLDKDKPTCGTSSGASTSWTNQSRTINQYCNDQNDLSGCTSNYYSKTFSSTQVTYTQTIRDNAGNTNTCTYNVYVDTDKPTCGTADGASTVWTSSNRTINQYCNDQTGLSGCTSNYYSNTYTSTTKTSSTTIKDNAGNTTTCSYNVYVDKTNPSASISISSRNSSYNTNSVNITVSGSDSHSGVSQYCVTTSNSSSGCSWQSSNTFNNVSTGYDYDGSSKTFYGFTKDAVGNISSSTSKTYTVYKYCTRTTVSGYGSYGSCSKSCGTGYKYRDVYYKDTYITSHTCPTDYSGSYTTCNTQSCCSSTYGVTDYNYCSKTCGGGNYLVKYYSNYDNSYCSQSYSGSSCNTQSCCNYDYSDGIYAYRYYGCDQVYVYYCQVSQSCLSNPQCYTSSGYVYRNSLSYSQPSYCVSICDYDLSTLAGTYKGSMSGNYGTWSSDWGFTYWCYNGSGCNRRSGYRIKCASSYCGSYKGWTMKDINSSAGCGFSTLWCSCSTTGQF